MTEQGPADVLLVEDNPGDVRLVREAFEGADFESRLHVVSDGALALSFLRQEGEHADARRPDIVLLDLNLPRKNGEEVLAALNEDPVLGRIPVIILTSSEDDDDVRSAYDRRANAYLTKPVDPSKFIELVELVQEFWLSAARLPAKEA